MQMAMTPAARTRPRRRSRAVLGAAALAVVLAVVAVVGYTIVANAAPVRRRMARQLGPYLMGCIG